MPSIKVLALAVMVAFAPLSSAKTFKATDALIGRDMHVTNKAARAVVSSLVGNEKRAKAKAAAARRVLARRAANPEPAPASVFDPYAAGSTFSSSVTAEKVATTRCAKAKYCAALTVIPHSKAVCLSTRLCQLQCVAGYAPGSGSEAQSCVLSSATCSVNTCPTVTDGFNTCSTAGACVPGCNPTYTLHANADASSYTCLNLSNDVNNCGYAGHTCAPSYNGIGTPSCFNGACSLTCPRGSYPYSSGTGGFSCS